MNREAGLAVMKALKHLAAQDHARSINELRIVVALERAIARIENVPELSSHVVFKGGFVLFKRHIRRYVEGFVAGSVQR
mgnify:FL=1